MSSEVLKKFIEENSGRIVERIIEAYDGDRAVLCSPFAQKATFDGVEYVFRMTCTPSNGLEVIYFVKKNKVKK